MDIKTKFNIGDKVYAFCAQPGGDGVMSAIITSVTVVRGKNACDNRMYYKTDLLISGKAESDESVLFATVAPIVDRIRSDALKACALQFERAERIEERFAKEKQP